MRICFVGSFLDWLNLRHFLWIPPQLVDGSSFSRVQGLGVAALTRGLIEAMFVLGLPAQS